MDSRRAIALALIAVVVINLVLFALGRLSELWFWLIVAGAAIATYFYKKRYKQSP